MHHLRLPRRSSRYVHPLHQSSNPCADLIPPGAHLILIALCPVNEREIAEPDLSIAARRAWSPAAPRRRLPCSSCFLHCCAMPAQMSAKLCVSVISLWILDAYDCLLFKLHTPATPPHRRVRRPPGRRVRNENRLYCGFASPVLSAYAAYVSVCCSR